MILEPAPQALPKIVLPYKDIIGYKYINFFFEICQNKQRMGKITLTFCNKFTIFTLTFYEKRLF